MDQQRIVGAWRLVSNEYRRVDGVITTPFGSDPLGLLIYTAEGYMSAQVGRRDRRPFAVDDMAAATPDELREAFTSCFAYFGPFAVDEAAGIVTHFIEGSTMPNWIGGQHRRLYSLSGDTLAVQSMSTYFYKGDEVTAVLTWRRVSATSV